VEVHLHDLHDADVHAVVDRHANDPDAVVPQTGGHHRKRERHPHGIAGGAPGLDSLDRLEAARQGCRVRLVGAPEPSRLR
jgi:hypothetical protein